MPEKTAFTIQIHDLTNLGQDRAVESFRRLLWAEASRVGIGRNLIDVPQCINVGDGGIDAYVENATPSIDEVIPRGISGFQIKSSDLNPSLCKKELHIKNNLDQPLKPEIKKILDQDGTYVVVIFADLPSPKKTAPREQAIKDELISLGYENPKVRLYTANKIQGFIERFPSLVAWFKNDLNQCNPYSSWTDNQEIKSPRQFVSDNERKKLADVIQENLRNPEGQCKVFRVTGLSGIGKTRFVYESLSPYDLRERVIYVRAEAFRLSTLYQTLQNDQSMSAIIVIDECGLRLHDEFVRSFSFRGERIALITISFELGNIPPPSLSLKLINLSEQSIENILKAEAPLLPENIIKRLSKFADGYPRIAVLLAESYLANRGNSQNDFLSVDDDSLMSRLIGGIDTCSDYFRKTKKVLEGLSLFSKVGFEGQLAKEAEWVARTINIDFPNFQEIVSVQRKRGIIQGQNYIYVTPFMLRIYLLKSWWEVRGLTKESFEEFVSGIPEEFRADILKRFFENLPYIASSEKGREFVMAILGADGLFGDVKLLQTQLGADFFLSLAEADPKSALLCLQNTVGKLSIEELKQFRTGRREVVWALEKIAVWKDLFIGAAKLLVILGEAENEVFANNASGVFADLFSPGPGRVAPTEASPEDRFPILEVTLNSASAERRNLAIKACDKALDTGSFTRMVGAEYQGVKKEAQLWEPKNYQEIINNYMRVWQLLNSNLESMPDIERREIIKILLGHIRGLSRFPEIAQIVLIDITKLAKKSYCDKKQIIDAIEGILHYSKKELPLEIVQKWKLLRDSLVGTDFHSLLERYAGMDLLVDRFDEDGNYVDKVSAHIKDLAQQSIANPNLLEPELTWLSTSNAENGYSFGYELGLQDNDFSLLKILIDTQRKIVEKKEASDYFFGGYLRALFEKDRKRWEALFDDLTKDNKLMSWIPVLTWRSGMTDRAALRILDLAQQKVIGPSHFRVFGLGSVTSVLSEYVFKQWIEFLLDCPEDYSVSIALDLFHSYYLRKETNFVLPEKLTFQLLSHVSLFRKPVQGRRNQMDDFSWKEIGNNYIKQSSNYNLQLAEIILEHFGEDGTILGDYDSVTQEVINNIARKYPSEVWDIVTKYLGPPIDSRAFHIKEWLRGSNFSSAGESGALPLFPPEKIWKWIDEDIDKRARYVANFVPKLLFRKNGEICLAREILVRYGNRDDVLKEIMANFYTESWTGPTSLHLQQKIDHLLAFKEHEDNQNVNKWIDEMVSSLDKQIKNEKIQEERESF